MGTRTVRLDDEAEKTLGELRALTGLSIPQVLNEGLAAFEVQALQQAKRKPYAIYRELDVGEGRYARSRAGQAKSAPADIIRRKHRP
jgi:hypothetical protein